MNTPTNIPAPLHSVADGNVVGFADELLDKTKNKKQSVINQEMDSALGNQDQRIASLEDTAVRYTEQEPSAAEQAQARDNLDVYSKEEVNNMVTTPDQNYVTVTATDQTTAATDVLPTTGEADTIYRVGNWNGTQYDPTMYALFAWNGTTYVCLAVRSFVGEVYDVSVNHPDGQGNPTPYADLTAALGTDGANIPADIRRGGMSIKFIQGTVQSSDNKYVQYRLMTDSFSTNEEDWAFMKGDIYVNNPEFIAVVLDKIGRIAIGLRSDGKIYYGQGLPPQLVEYFQEKIDGKTLIDAIYATTKSTTDNPEYIEIRIDNNNVLIEGIDSGGNKILFRNLKLQGDFYSESLNLKSTQYIDILSAIIDKAEKIISYYRLDGIKVENFGLKTPNVITEDINLGESGKNKIKDIVINDGDILSLYPPKVILPILKTFKHKPTWFLPYSENYKYINFNLLWFSDLHHVDRRLARISKFYNRYKNYIDDVVSTGDAINSFNESSFDYWRENGAASFLNVIGNHECFGPARTDGTKTLPGWIPPGYSGKECYDKYFKDYLSDTSVNIQANTCYFYKDYSIENGYKIRIIGIDYYHWKEQRTYSDGTPMTVYPDGQPVDTGQQQLWLRGVLRDAYDNDYSVICMMHNPVSLNNLTGVDTSFQCKAPYMTAENFTKTEILDEVQTFIGGYGNVDSQGNPIKGKFITWLTGHTHDDRFGTITSHPDQLMITIGTAGNLIQAPGSQWEHPSFMDRTEETMNDDLFDLVSVNVYAGCITLYRVGCPYDKHGRHLDSISYDYINKQII